ncbi:MAG: hypothetical protein KAX72_09195 [Chitinophagales bacterium]|nr:hypothetical protein [Chitinophagales bacterium]
MDKVINYFRLKNMGASHGLMTGVVVLLGGFNLLFGEIVPAGGGFGWDGVIYANMTRNIDSFISNGQLSGYYAQRIIPSIIVREILILSDTAFSDINIIRGFLIYNLMLLVVASWVWKRLSDKFALSVFGRWIGFCGIFINFSVSKQAFYYPVLTDVTALLLGLLLLLFYVEKRPIAILITAIVGAFVWQLASIYGAILLLFLKSKIPNDAIDSENNLFDISGFAVKRIWLVTLMLSIIGILFISFILDAYQVSNIDYHLNKYFSKITSVESSELEIVPLITGIPSVFAVFVALFVLIGSRSVFQVILKDTLKPNPILMAFAIAAILIPFLVVKAISNPLLPNANGVGWVLLHAFFIPPAGKVLLPLVSLAVFWGPVVLLILINWNAFCVELRKLGPGVMVVVGLSLPLGLVTEPRYITSVWPFMVFGLVLTLEHCASRSQYFKWVFAILTVLFAQFWLKINIAPWSGGEYEQLLEFPKQMFFFHYGFWMSWPSYLVQFPIVLLGVFLLKKSMFYNALYENTN